MFCKNCGKLIGDAGTDLCEDCSVSWHPHVAEDIAGDSPKDVQDGESGGSADAKPKQRPKRWMIAIAVVAAALLLVAASVGYLATRCYHVGCLAAADCGSYCAEHVCSLYPDCSSERQGDSPYCAYHETLAKALSSKTANISVSNTQITKSSSGSYTYAKGTVTNNGLITMKYVKVKGAFKDSTGKVIDTDWTYAVGSEGLAPGESTTFDLSVKYDSRIKSVSVTVMDD